MADRSSLSSCAHRTANTQSLVKYLNHDLAHWLRQVHCCTNHHWRYIVSSTFESSNCSVNGEARVGSIQLLDYASIPVHVGFKLHVVRGTLRIGGSSGRLNYNMCACFPHARNLMPAASTIYLKLWNRPSGGWSELAFGGKGDEIQQLSI